MCLCVRWFRLFCEDLIIDFEDEIASMKRMSVFKVIDRKAVTVDDLTVTCIEMRSEASYVMMIGLDTSQLAFLKKYTL